MQAMDKKQFSALLGKIREHAKKQREQIHTALIQCAYFAAFDRNMDPALRLFAAIGGETYKAGMSKWLSLNAPVHFKEGKPLLSDKRQKELTVTPEEFFTHIEQQPAWYAVDEKNNETPNVWDGGAKLSSLRKYLSTLEKGAKEARDEVMVELVAALVARVNDSEYDSKEVEA